MEQGEKVDPFVVRAVAPHKPKGKGELEFKKGQEITVERINKDNATYFGFYGKKEGWFPDYFVQRAEGVAPVIRKSASAAKPPKKEEHAGNSNAGESKPSKHDLKKQEKLDKSEAHRKKKEDKTSGKKVETSKKRSKKGAGSQKASGDKPAEDKAVTPAIVELTVAYLEHPDRLKLEGLFRVSGSLTDVKAIKAEFLKGKKVDLSKVSDPHTVAGVLKIFFRESKDPLLTFELYDCWVAAVATPARNDRIHSVRQVIDLLPPTNRKILHRLLGLLTKVAEYEKYNLMSVNNIAIVFAPTLLRPPGDKIDIAIQDSSYANHLIKFMIEEYDALFSDKPPPPKTGELDPEDNPNLIVPPPRPRTVPAAVAAAAAGPSSQLPGESDDQFEKRIRRGSLLMARGSMIGINSFQELVSAEAAQEEDEDVSIHVSSEDIEGNKSDTVGSDNELTDEGDEGMSMEEMMDKILEGHVNEVDEFLATLPPDQAAATKKELLEKIDALMQSDEFKD